MGVINVSPESFYPGSVCLTQGEVEKKALRMVEEGADIIDIGAMSSAPYKQTWVSEEVEMERMAMAVQAVKNVADIPISADTTRSSVARLALRLGAEMINDVSGLRHSPDMVEVVKDYSASLIVMANNVERTEDVILGIIDQLRWAVEKALSAGIEQEHIIVDPGIGFHRNLREEWYLVDAEILRRLRELEVLGRPICVGVSRKSFIGRATGKEDPEERLIGSVAAEALVVYNGADVIRTHNVRESLEAVRVASLIRGRKYESGV
jgi:dihydropteroate synthase